MRTAIALTVALASLALAGCEENPITRPAAIYEVSSSREAAALKECLSSVPGGPSSTTYNDWSEVVESCREFASYNARRCVANCENQKYLRRGE